MPSTDVDICVIGGGPGGSVIARLLAHLGHKTLLIDRSLAPQRSRVESLAPTIRPILDSVDLSHAIEPSIFHRERFALVRWDTETIQTKLFEPPSLLVDRLIEGCTMQRRTLVFMYCCMLMRGHPSGARTAAGSFRS